jgi:predicted nucleic acid-binding protein
MKRLKVYLETSVFGFMLEEEHASEKASTQQLFQEIIHGNLEAYVSGEVVRELGRAPEPIRGNLLQMIPRYGLKELEVTAEARALARQYIEAGVIPAKVEPDALHLAIASTHGLDAVVSWNLQHIVKTRTRMGVNGINKLLGYREVEIATPQEVISA